MGEWNPSQMMVFQPLAARRELSTLTLYERIHGLDVQRSSKSKA